MTMLTILKKVTYFSAILVLLPNLAFGQQTNTPATPTTTNAQSTPAAENEPAVNAGETDPKKASGGKIGMSGDLYVETGDLIQYNSRYINKRVKIYSYFTVRPNEQTILFEDYKKNKVQLFLKKSNLVQLPNLYEGKLYEIEAIVGKVRDNQLQLHFLSMEPTFRERKFEDQVLKDANGQ